MFILPDMLSVIVKENKKRSVFDCFRSLYNQFCKATARLSGCACWSVILTCASLWSCAIANVALSARQTWMLFHKWRNHKQSFVTSQHSLSGRGLSPCPHEGRSPFGKPKPQVQATTSRP